MDAMQKFQNLLGNLFQFDASDLDFGIYRILNFKRDQIRTFIHEDLKNTVETAFAKHKDERLDNIGLQLEDTKQKVIQTLGMGAILATGELKDEFKGTPVGRDYLSIKTQKEEAETIDEIKLQVFNDLYNFFARYYEEGDFVPQYRYSIKNHKYAIPYNGEEVKLYWANCDQYYTKTGILFRDYAFFTDTGKTFKVVLRTVTAKEELGSNKATKARFFVLDGDTPWEMKDGKTLIIRFQYRELSSGEVKKCGVEGGSNTTRQEKINSKIHEAVIEGMRDATFKAFLGGPYKNDKPLFLYQLGRFTAKNTKDYFIHKNLKRFLSDQLDYFIKAEVISLETLDKERFFDKHITRAKVVREIGEKIIDFLSQIEDFQKKLWEKKKFVLKTEYVITTDRVPEDFYAEVLKNKAQAKEWKELGFEGTKSEAEIKDKKLPIDTKHFPEEFKERLLERLTENTDLDDLLDGLLIESENWQALNLLQGKYREKVKCIYIDPPYNTGDSEILYKNEYLSSSWLTLMENRLAISVSMLSEDPVLFIAIDDFEMVDLCELIDTHFSFLRREMIIVNHHPQGGKAKTLANTHEYMLVCVARSQDRTLTGRLSKEGVEYRPFKRSGTADSNFRYGRPNSFYAILIEPESTEVVGVEPPPEIGTEYPTEETEEGFVRVYPLDSQGKERVWRRSYESCLPLISEKKLYCSDNMTIYQLIKAGDRTSALFSNWIGSRYNAGTFGANLLRDIIGEQNPFSYPKSVHTVEDAIFSANLKDGAICLDYFAGSGTTAHAVINLNREDKCKRRYILVEMGNYFESVLLPRIKKIIQSDEWKNGKPQNNNGISHFIKYQYLEQYEDALDNLELKPNPTTQSLFGNDYLLKYFLDFETKDNPTLLNIEHLKKPFSYKLKVNLEEVGEPQEVVVDIPETFHYLLGLKVNKVKVRRHKGRKYLFTVGEKESRTIAVVWRECDDEWTQADFKKDKEFIIEELSPWSPQIVYVNGQSVLTPTFGDHVVEIRSIEPEFKRLMEG